MINVLRDAVKVHEHILNAYFKHFGFKRTKREFTKFTFKLIFRNENLYVIIYGSNHGMDYPGYLNLIFGDGDDTYPERDRNSAAIWAIQRYYGLNDAKEYNFQDIYNQDFAEGLIADMDKYTLSFLQDKDSSIIQQARQFCCSLR